MKFLFFSNIFLIILIIQIEACFLKRLIENSDDYNLKRLIKSLLQKREEGDSTSIEQEDVDISKYMDPHFVKYGFDGEIPKDILAYLAYMDDGKNYNYWIDFYKSQLKRKQQQQQQNTK